jgi:hypothetical protein
VQSTKDDNVTLSALSKDTDDAAAAAANVAKATKELRLANAKCQDLTGGAYRHKVKLIVLMIVILS